MGERTTESVSGRQREREEAEVLLLLLLLAERGRTFDLHFDFQHKAEQELSTILTHSPTHTYRYPPLHFLAYVTSIEVFAKCLLGLLSSFYVCQFAYETQRGRQR